jgi:rubrerythrin
VSIPFSGSKLINIAIGIERNGSAFYDIMARSVENTMTRDVFLFLADMEREHIQVFQDMLSEVDRYQISETRTEKRADYLQALVDNAVFSDDMITSEMTTQTDTDIKALELSIGAEKDSILFYYEVKDLLPKQGQSLIDKIITEEKSHLRQLSEIKRKMTPL